MCTYAHGCVRETNISHSLVTQGPRILRASQGRTEEPGERRGECALLPLRPAAAPWSPGRTRQREELAGHAERAGRPAVSGGRCRAMSCLFSLRGAGASFRCDGSGQSFPGTVSPSPARGHAQRTAAASPGSHRTRRGPGGTRGTPRDSSGGKAPASGAGHDVTFACLQTRVVYDVSAETLTHGSDTARREGTVGHGGEQTPGAVLEGEAG